MKSERVIAGTKLKPARGGTRARAAAKTGNIPPFSAHLFWDTNIDKIDCEKDKDLIIERVLVFGSENDERLLYALYSEHAIKKTAKKSMNLNDRTIACLSAIFNIPKEKFKCYGKRPYSRN